MEATIDATIMSFSSLPLGVNKSAVIDYGDCFSYSSIRECLLHCKRSIFLFILQRNASRMVVVLEKNNLLEIIPCV